MSGRKLVGLVVAVCTALAAAATAWSNAGGFDDDPAKSPVSLTVDSTRSDRDTIRLAIGTSFTLIGQVRLMARWQGTPPSSLAARLQARPLSITPESTAVNGAYFIRLAATPPVGGGDTLYGAFKWPNTYSIAVTIPRIARPDIGITGWCVIRLDRDEDCIGEARLRHLLPYILAGLALMGVLIGAWPSGGTAADEQVDDNRVVTGRTVTRQLIVEITAGPPGVPRTWNKRQRLCARKLLIAQFLDQAPLDSVDTVVECGKKPKLGHAVRAYYAVLALKLRSRVQEVARQLDDIGQ